MLLYGFKQLELVGLVFVWAIHLVLPWFHIFFSPIFAPKPPERVKKAKLDPKPKDKLSKKDNPFDEGSEEENPKPDNPFG
jgi:hypothetical protein